MIKMIIALFMITSLCSSEVVKDNETGLVWQDSSNTVKRDWSGAKEYCADLTLEGYSDWRLADISELKKISKKCKYHPNRKSILRNAKSNYYWSASKVAKYKNKSRAWVVLLNDGYVNWRSAKNSNLVRCVRADKL